MGKLVLALFFVPSVSFATWVSHSDDMVPFSCGHAIEIAQPFLEQQCADLGLVLKNMRLGACSANGDDGGYVNYFAVTVSGLCVATGQ